MKNETEQLHRLSVNTHFLDKTPPKDNKFLAEGFEPYELTLLEIAEVVQNGFAISYQFASGHRKTENFLATDFLAVDIDGGLSIQECLEQDLIKRYCSMLYTTPSHNVDQHRYRLIFSLPKTIVDSRELRFATSTLSRRLGGDPTATDAARMFFGSKDCIVKYLGGKISSGFLEELVEEGRRQTYSETVGNNLPTANRSNQNLDPNQHIRTSYGVQIAVRDILEKTQVYCPFHFDRHPSAFVNRSKRGVYLHCSTCRTTWWDSSRRLELFDFQSFERAVVEAQEAKKPRKKDDLTGLEPFYEAPPLEPQNILICNDQYLDPAEIMRWDCSDGVTFVKSPKGTGKTTFLSKVVGNAIHRYESLEDYENSDDPDSPHSFFTGKKVLLIGHRQALIGELCQRLQLNCYLDYHPTKTGFARLSEARNRFGVCLDSLWQVDGSSYDMIVIDESEQVIAHFLSETIGASRMKIFRTFCDLMKSAKNVIALDADLSWISFHTIVSAKQARLATLNALQEKSKKTDVRIVLNQWQDVGRSLDIFNNEKHLVADLKASILSGKRVFVTSNSKKKIESLSAAIGDLARVSDQAFETITITSANSKSPEVQSFIKDIKNKILSYQVILSSPSLGTGVDISFDANAQHIDCVYGLFESRITSHFEIDQQLGRVRNPRQIKLWINAQQFQFETEFEIVVDEIMRSNLADSLQLGDAASLTEVPATHLSFLKMAALVTRSKRASKNQLKANFIAYKKQSGYKLNFIDKDEELAVDGLQFIKIGRANERSRYVEQLLSVKTLNEIKFKQLRWLLDAGTESLTDAERFQLRRTSMELFYREPLTEYLVELDDDGKFRTKIRLMETLLKSNNGVVNFRDKIPEHESREVIRSHIELISDKVVGAALLSEVLSLTPCFIDGSFDSTVLYTAEDLSLFGKASSKLKRFVEGQFDLHTKNDIQQKPIQHLGKLLKLVGLAQELKVTKTVSGHKVRYYRLDQDRYETVSKCLDRRKSIDSWQFLNHHYGFRYSAEEVEWLSETIR